MIMIKKILLLALLFSVSLALIASGAFTSVIADRTATINVVGETVQRYWH